MININARNPIILKKHQQDIIKYTYKMSPNIFKFLKVIKKESFLLDEKLVVVISTRDYLLLYESHIYSLYSIQFHLRYDLLTEGVPGS